MDDRQRDQLAVLLDALDCPVTDTERSSLEWLAGWEKHVIEDIANAIKRAVWTATERAENGTYQRLAIRRTR